MGTHIDTLTGETVDLLQQMIRNQCVNDGTPDSGNEVVNAELLRNELEGLGLDFDTLEERPGRTSLIARYEGTDPDAPSLCLMGHTDVVPVDHSGWDNDPFGGELIETADGVKEVWGRGAVDMLNLTASMAVAFREIVRSGKRYPGDIIYFAVADEEAGGVLGAKPIVDKHWDLVGCDYLLTEYGGTPAHGPDGTRVLLTAGEKTGAARKVTIHGTPGHGSMPYATDNALVKAAEIVRRIQAAELEPRIDEMFTERVKALGLAPEQEAGLLDPGRITETLAQLPPGLARNTHSCCHTTISANMLTAGDKLNTIANRAELSLDIRMLPGQTQTEIDELLEEIIGPDLMPDVDIEWLLPNLQETAPYPSSTDSPLWSALSDAIHIAYPEAMIIPSLVTGGTDARFFRQKGVPCYGAGLLSNKVTVEEFLNRFHGHNERIDTESLKLTTQMWLDVCDRLWATG